MPRSGSRREERRLPQKWDCAGVVVDRYSWLFLSLAHLPTKPIQEQNTEPPESEGEGGCHGELPHKIPASCSHDADANANGYTGIARRQSKKACQEITHGATRGKEKDTSYNSMFHKTITILFSVGIRATISEKVGAGHLPKYSSTRPS